MTENSVVKKYHNFEFLKNKKTILVILITSLLLGMAAIKILFDMAVNRPSLNTMEVTFEIPSGASINEISQRLYEQNLINSTTVFKIYLASKGLDDKIQAGVYTIPAGTTIAELSNILQLGKDDKKITFLEGWRVEEIARHASSNFDKVDYEKFLKLAKENEGKLFPDTYIFNSNITEEELLEKLLENFEIKTKDMLTEENLKKVNLSKEEVLIIASIVEREVKTIEDKKIVAGILIKRYKNGDLLGADATTQYAIAPLRYGCLPNSDTLCPSEKASANIEWWPKDLTIEELNYDSPYNTRKKPGLPPKPISNPGLGSIEAVLNYIDTEYYYYLNDNTGKTHFSKTLEEHNSKVAKYLN